MEVKPKKCKGTGKALGFGCGVPTLYRKYGLGLNCGCYRDWLLNTPNGQEVIRKSTITAKKKVKRNVSKKTREQKEVLKNKSAFEKDLQTLVNKIVRLVDIDRGCISCTHGHYKPWTRQAHAGHYKSVGGNPTLRFNFDNIHKQCSICNNHKHANIEEYQKGLKSRYGTDYFEYVESLTSKFKVLNLSIPELKEAIIKARKIIKEIEQGKDFTRTELNLILNIYKNEHIN